MGILRRLKRLEEQCATPEKKEDRLIIRVRRFSQSPSDLPPVEEQIARQKKEGRPKTARLERSRGNGPDRPRLLQFVP